MLCFKEKIDGELLYDGFTVYTVKTATWEYVYNVL